MEHSEIVLSGQTILQLTFDPGVFGHIPVTARCQLDHPFYVKDKGVAVGGAETLCRRPYVEDPLTRRLLSLQAGRPFIPA